MLAGVSCVVSVPPHSMNTVVHRKDAALERRFQQVYVDQPSVPDTVSILRGLKERYEVHHGVKISDSALVAAATLSRYISDRFLPDKAIDRRRSSCPAENGDYPSRKSSMKSTAKSYR